MSKKYTVTFLIFLLASSLTSGGLDLGAGPGGASAYAQELTARPEESAAAEPPNDGSTTTTPASANATKEATSAESSAEKANHETTETETVVEVQEGTTATPTGLGSKAVIGCVLVGLFVLPVLIGNWLAKRVSMPEYGWKISLVLMTITAAGIILYFGEIKFGPDLAGGITLIYELADTSAAEEEVAPADGEVQQDANPKGPSRELVRRLTEALKQRVDPAGTKEVTIRPYGSAIEIIIPRTGQDDLKFVKRRITSLGQLEFRITADPRWGERDQNIIEQARSIPPEQKVVELNGEAVAEWVPYEEKEFGPFDQPDDRIQKRMAGKNPEALVLRDPWNVTGEYLQRAFKDFDQKGGPAVGFSFDSRGSRKFGRLTGDNKPNPSTGAQRYLGIVLDNRLLSAPSIREKITGQGQISGGAMTEDEVDFTISILDAGSLPAALNPDPISEEIISSTLGAETVEKGRTAIVISLAAILIFIAFYYRFAGIVACLALITNLSLVLGVMVLIRAAFTLPGLAGLVLTVGMSVDANVLIFERIREELKRGSALRMAIRNGFGRATTTIVDANLTTLITGIVLYAIGTDQIKGFAVTLILGILMSMYTAIFCSRVIFDIAERRRWITKLKMSHILGQTKFDFIGKRYVAGAISAILIIIGLIGVVQRGEGILNIDFTGGTSVTMVFDKDHPMKVGDVRTELEKTDLRDKNLLVVERGETRQRFTVNTSLDSVTEVEDILTKTFGDRLKTYAIDIGELQEVEENGFKVTQATVSINEKDGYQQDSGIGHDALAGRISEALENNDDKGSEPELSTPGYQAGSSAQFKKWNVRLGLDTKTAQKVFDQLAQSMGDQPMFPLANKIGGKVAGNMQVLAAYAILVSLLGIVGYLWIRFQKVAFGLAAVVALVHDVLVTLGMIALSIYVVSGIPTVADALQIDAFQISLPIVAAFLTIIGYSLNDTIVVFDRIREVRGKSSQLTSDMINASINQTLSRTLLTSLTTLAVVLILYFAGGAGIHGFAFALVIGVIVGTYSSIFVASPALLAMSGFRGKAATNNSK